MKYRRLDKPGFEVSEVSLGTWQLGDGWGSVSETDAVRVLETRYQWRRQLFRHCRCVRRWPKRTYHRAGPGCASEKIYIATKAGRRLQPHTPEGYDQKNLTEFV